MAKVKFKNVKKVTKRLQKQFTAFTENDVEMDKVSKVMRTELIDNLRSGIGGDDELLPQLKTSTIRRRGRLATVNRTAAKYFAFFSNATFSGQLIRSLRVTAVKSSILGTRLFWFDYQGKHKGYKNLNGSRQKDQDNGDIARELIKRGWKLAGVTASAQQRIIKQFRRFLRRANKKR